MSARLVLQILQNGPSRNTRMEKLHIITPASRINTLSRDFYLREKLPQWSQGDVNPKWVFTDCKNTQNDEWEQD